MPTRDRFPLANTLVIVAGLAIAGGVVYWMLGADPSRLDAAASGASPEQDIGFGPFEYDVDRLRLEWEREREGLDAVELGDEEELLIDEFHRINQRSVAPDLAGTELQSLSDGMMSRVSDYVSRRGPSAYSALGWRLADEFQGALIEATLAAEEMSVTPAEAVASENGRGRGLSGRLGNFFTVAARTGLLDDRGRLRYDATLATILFRYRWFSFAREYSNLSRLAPYERIVFWRWRIEAAHDVPLEQRIAMVGEVAAIYSDTLDPDAVRGILFYREELFDRAAAFFRRAQRTHPDDPRYADFLAAANARVEATDTSQSDD